MQKEAHYGRLHTTRFHESLPDAQTEAIDPSDSRAVLDEMCNLTAPSCQRHPTRSRRMGRRVRIRLGKTSSPLGQHNKRLPSWNHVDPIPAVHTYRPRHPSPLHGRRPPRPIPPPQECPANAGSASGAGDAFPDPRRGRVRQGVSRLWRLWSARSADVDGGMKNFQVWVDGVVVDRCLSFVGLFIRPTREDADPQLPSQTDGSDSRFERRQRHL